MNLTKKPRKIASENEPVDPNARPKRTEPTCSECGLPVVQTHGSPDFDERGWFTPTTWTCSDGHVQKIRHTHEPLNTSTSRERSVENRRVNLS
jgi:hypothetical protein